MNKLELFVNGIGSTIGQIDLYGDEPISLSISIQDIKDISKRSSTVSQTFTIPANKNNNVLLNHIFNIGTDSSFDPRKKTPCYLLNDTVPVFTGNFQLTKINVKNANVISYECVVYGETIDLVKTLGDKLLTDLDYTELDHIYSVDNIENSWTADTKSLGYYYPLIDYGYDLNVSELNDGVLNIVLDSGVTTGAISTQLTDSTKLWNTNAFAGKTLYITEGAGVGQSRTIVSNTLTVLTISTPWTTIPDATTKYNITQLDYSNPYSSTGNGLSPLFFKPALSNTYLFRKILSNAGFSIESDIIDGDIIGETIIPYNGNVQDAVPKEYMDEYAFRASLATDQVSSDITYTNIIALTDTSTPPNYDPGSLFNQPGFPYRYVADRHCTMSFVVNVRWYLTGTSVVAPKRITVEFYRDSYLAGPFSVKSYDTPGVPTLGIDYNNVFQSEKLDNPQSTNGLYPVQPGEVFYAIYRFEFGGGNHIVVVRAHDTYMYNVPTPKLVPNGKLFYNKFVPNNVKQIDYVKSIITMFNLMVIPDKNNPKRLKFIPRDEYFASGDIKDWTDKVDHTEKVEETLISEQQNKTIRLTYKEDKDFYNTNYKDNTNTVFGEYIKSIDNEWVDGEKKIEVIFSPTPIDKVLGSTNIFVPKIVKRDEKTGVYSRMDFNIRFLRKNATLMPTLDTIQLEGKPPINAYPYCGHLDHPINATVDYNFGEIQYSYYPELTSLTPNNLVNNYWKKFLDGIADKNSKLIKLKVYLTPNDIATFNYNDTIFIDQLTDDGGHYFIVNKITYIPTSNLPSVVELIRIDEKPIDSLEERRLVNPIELAPIKALEFGAYNKTRSTSITLGNSNIIGTNANRALIVGDNNTITNNVTNVTLLGTSGKTITESNTTFVVNTEFTADGKILNKFNDLELGEDTVLNPFNVGIFNDVESGSDAVLNIGGVSPINDVDSGEDIVYTP